MKLLQDNLRFLRGRDGYSINEIAKNLGIKNRSTYYAWERGDSQPSLSMILKIAKTYDVSLDELLQQDLSRKKQVVKKDDDVYDIELVPKKAAAGYAQYYQDPDWHEKNIQTIKIPFKPPIGETRAFPISGDSMMPKVSDGSFVVAVKLLDTKEVKEGQDYIIITKDHGILYKRLFWRKEDHGVAQLISDNPNTPPREILSEDILELWKFHLSIDSKQS